TAGSRAVRVAFAAVAVAGCSPANVYPITGGASADGGDVGANPEPAACRAMALQAGDVSRTVQVGSQARTYVLHVPPAYDGAKPAPLVLDFHGMGESGASERASSPYPAALDPEGV